MGWGVTPSAEPARIQVDKLLQIVPLGEVPFGPDNGRHAITVVVEVVHLTRRNEVRVHGTAGSEHDAERTRVSPGRDASNRRPHGVAASVLEDRVPAALRHEALRGTKNLRHEQLLIRIEEGAHGPPRSPLCFARVNGCRVRSTKRCGRWRNIAKHVVEICGKERRDVPELGDQLREEYKKRIPHPNRVTIEPEVTQKVPQLRLRQQSQILIRSPELRHLNR